MKATQPLFKRSSAAAAHYHHAFIMRYYLMTKVPIHFNRLRRGSNSNSLRYKMSALTNRLPCSSHRQKKFSNLFSVFDFWSHFGAFISRYYHGDVSLCRSGWLPIVLWRLIKHTKDIRQGSQYKLRKHTK